MQILLILKNNWKKTKKTRKKVSVTQSEKNQEEDHLEKRIDR